MATNKRQRVVRQAVRRGVAGYRGDVEYINEKALSEPTENKAVKQSVTKGRKAK